MTMKRNTILSAITGATLLLFVAACSNSDDNTNGNNNEPKEPTQTVQFSFTDEDFGEDETPTRAGTAEAKPQIVDLGDCEAEISVESEPAVKKTRGAQTPANGHYTICAYQGGTLKGEMSGTFSGGTFTPDVANKGSIKLAHGTYDFIAFNDDVIPSGNDLTVAKDKAGTAMIGFANAEHINQNPNQTINFTMKHVGARLRTQFVCQKHIPENITATLEQTAANVIPTSIAYNPATKTYTATNGAMTAEASNSPASTETKYTASFYGKFYSYTSTSDYHYFLPTTEGSKLKLTGISAGTVFWKPIPTFNVASLNASLQMQSNKSYVVKIKLKPSFTYLMSDGTTGFFKDTTLGGGTKTPIGLVIGNNRAIALNCADGNNKSLLWLAPSGGWWHGHNNSKVIKFTEILDAYNDMDGYKYTWEASGSYDNTTIKANEKDKYPAFYYAGHYGDELAAAGITVSGNLVGRKWYMPSVGEIEDMHTTLVFGEVDSESYGGKYYFAYTDLINQAVTRVGGQWYLDTSFYGPISTGHTSTEYYDDRLGLPIASAPHNRFYFNFSSTYCRIWRDFDVSRASLVRPIIKYQD